MPEFPAKRFREAGATRAEVAQLEAEFERSDATAQSGLASSFASQSQGVLREHVADLRAAGHFAQNVDEGVEPDEPSHLDDEDDDETVAPEAEAHDTDPE
jgi:hypothetical protein